MSDNWLDMEELQEEHFDLMLRLAFRFEDMLIARCIEMQESQALTPEEEARFDRAVARAFERIREEEIREQRRERAARWRRRMQRAAVIVAGVVLAFSVTASIAVANVAAIRAGLVQLLIGFDQEEEERVISFSSETEVEIPSDWPGDYFPTYLPEGTSIEKQRNEDMPAIVFGTKNGGSITFTKCDSNTQFIMGTHDGDISNEIINGHDATVTEYDYDGHTVSIIWSIDSDWFHLETYGLETSEAILIAESVRRIEKD